MKNLDPEETSKQIATSFFGVEDDASRRRAIIQLLFSAVACAVLVPAIFWLRFGEVSGLAWGTTIFFVAYCLLAAIGLYFQPRTAYHTPVRLRGDWLDRIGAFWLVCCVFGPLLGWMITSVFPITVDTWRGLYATRVFLAAGLPLITAAPLTRYLRGKAVMIALPILVLVTLLPIWSVADVTRDLVQGPIVQQNPATDQSELYLQYTEQSLGIAGEITP